jgi:hypothetical protein
MAFLRNLFGNKQPETTSTNIEQKTLTSENIQTIVDLAESLAGGWPEELPRDDFDKLDFNKLLGRSKRYQLMAHPRLPSGREIKPEYQIVKGEIARASFEAEDFKLVMTAQMLSAGNMGTVDSDGMELLGHLAFKVIEYYSKKRLAKFLFLLPRARDAELLSKGGKAILVAEYLLMDVYKGVENILFEIYDELSEGKKFDDTLVIQKLLSIVEWARP